MSKKPGGFNEYLVKTKWGAIYLISRPMQKNGLNYYESIYYDSGSLKDEDIENWIGVDNEIFKKEKKND